MSRRRLGYSVAVMFCILVLAVAAAAQEGILSFTLDSEIAEAAPGARATVHIHIDNPTVREADEIEASWAGEAAFALDPPPDRIGVLPPFQSAVMTVSILVPEDAPAGDAVGAIEFVYTYCIGDLCFQIVEGREVVVRVAEPAGHEAAAGPTRPASAPSLGRAWVPLALTAWSLALLFAAVYARLRGTRWPLYVALIVLAAGGLSWGVVLDQQEQAQGIGSVLCTSCVGIEEARTHEPHLSSAQVEEIRALIDPVELLVFYAPWCHSCPYAEELVQKAASLNSRLTYRFINVDEDPSSAERHGVIRSGRTVVPAIVRVDTGEVLFGVEDLQNRLIGLLKGGG